MKKSELLYAKAKAALEDGKIKEVFEILGSENTDENIQVLFLKAEAFYHLQNWGEALNYFQKVLSIDPGEKKAQTYITMIQNILSFYHTDFFNP